MTMQYKVWLEVEEIDEACNHYQNIDLPFAGLATFDSREAAVAFAESVQHQYKPPAKDAIHITWSVEDVTEVRPDLTFAQAMAVLRRAAIHHDATIGINWDTLSFHADELYPHPHDHRDTSTTPKDDKP